MIDISLRRVIDTTLLEYLTVGMVTLIIIYFFYLKWKEAHWWR